jgi:hypothetical protein
MRNVLFDDGRLEYGCDTHARLEDLDVAHVLAQHD